MVKNKSLVPTKSILPRAMSIVSYLTPEEVYQIADACDGRNKERNELLILALFETGLRISEALDITPRKVGTYNGHAVLYIKGNGKKPQMVACPDNLAYQLKELCLHQEAWLG